MTIYLIQLVFGVTLLTAVALVICRLLKQRSASSRHAVLAAALLGLLLLPLVLPLLPTLLPRWSLVTLSVSEIVTTSAISEPNTLLEPAVIETTAHIETMHPAPVTQPFETPVMQTIAPVAVESEITQQTVEIAKQAEQRGFAADPLLTLRALISWDMINSALIVRALLCVWVLGTIILLLRLIVSFHAARKLLESTLPLDATPLEQQLETLGKRLGVTRRVQLRQSEIGLVPFTVGVRRPVIVLPESATGWSDMERRAVLTHELGHVARNDVVGQWLAECVMALFWFHPLVWLTCRQLRIEREIACDDLVVLAGEEPPVYADILLRLAAGLKNKAARRHALGCTIACTVAMARHHEVKKRIALILDPAVLRKPLGRFGTAVVLIAAVTCVTLAAMLAPGERVGLPEPPTTEAMPSDVTEGTEGIDVSAQTEAIPISTVTKDIAPEYIPDSVEVTVTDESGKPMKDVLLKVRLARDNKEFRTDENGKVTVDTKPYKNSTGWYIFTAYAPDRVTTEWSWLLTTDEKRTIPPAFTIRLMPGYTIGGTVVDEQGNPVAGAKVVPSYDHRQSRGDMYHSEQTPRPIFDGILTDDQGKWQAEGYSKTNGHIMITVTHDDYLPIKEDGETGAYSMSDILAGNVKTVLKRGFPVRGTVWDENGTPIPGIRIFFDHPHIGNHSSAERVTDSEGRYEVKSWYRRPTSISVLSRDWAPQWGKIDFASSQYTDETGATLDYTLKKGKTIRMKLVDPQGEAIRQFWVWFNSGVTMGETYLGDLFHPHPNEEGIWEWTNAPDDELEFDVDSIDGYERVFAVKMSPRDEPYVVTPKPRSDTVVSGSVMDSETKKPIANFHVIRGMIRTTPEPDYEDEFWFRESPSAFQNGVYSMFFAFGPEPVGGAIRLNAMRFEAVGYEPYQTPPIELNGQRQTLDIELVPSETKPVRAVVLLPDGKPAIDAEVGLGGLSGIAVRTENDRIASNTGNAIVRTDGNGRFEFPNPGVPYVILAAHPDGFAFATQTEVESGTIPMIPWARIEGTAYDGDKPVANASLWGSFDMPQETVHHETYGQVYLPQPPRPQRYESQVRTTTDATGKFVLERVAPGLTGSMGFMNASIYTVDNFTTESGKTTTIRIEKREKP
ncbi:MAG: hypothetical protein FWD31_08215 [Planctomycetaceae bacterium]|nr:hypothetical protein [Planctomycetaceae bacterium]